MRGEVPDPKELPPSYKYVTPVYLYHTIIDNTNNTGVIIEKYDTNFRANVSDFRYTLCIIYLCGLSKRNLWCNKLNPIGHGRRTKETWKK
jgi:hypothetical protein